MTDFMNRFVSIILIIAVLQCTFSCSSGSCCAIDSESRVAPQSAKSCCSHCRGAAETSSALPGNSESEIPAESDENQDPDSCTCQGVCSGTIPSKQIELKTAPTSAPLGLIAELPVLFASSGLISRATAVDLHARITPHGLAMRVRVCSLTC